MYAFCDVLLIIIFYNCFFFSSKYAKNEMTMFYGKKYISALDGKRFSNKKI